MRLYNSMSQELEDFVVDDNRVGVYVCGVTPYDTTHIGHAFTFLTFDVLVRYLRFHGYNVTYVQNVTDIDDDILRKSAEVGLDWRELGTRETNQLLDDLSRLNAVPFDHFTAATDHINEVIELVKVLVDKGFAYESNGSVYFHVSMADDFGKLSHLDPNEMLPIANERGNNPNDPNKQNPIDFVLWQAGILWRAIPVFLEDNVARNLPENRLTSIYADLAVRARSGGANIDARWRFRH